MLVQAKQADGNLVQLTSKSEKFQFHLLSVRPPFDVDAKPAPNGVVLPKSRNGHDMALLYGANPPKSLPAPAFRCPRWKTAGKLATSAVKNQATLSTNLAQTLAGLLAGKIGWSFALPPAPGGTWHHFAGSASSSWALLINYLLETTFAKPLASLGLAIGHPFRGIGHALYLRSRSAKGKVMFFYTDFPEDGSAFPPLGWMRGNGEGLGWDLVSSLPLNELGGGDSGGGSEEGRDAHTPDNGPISVVVFELGRQTG